MRIRSVTAHAFGPLAGETLELAEGLTVVHGANESAKSSWHAAIYAALCGRRRGRGRPSEEEQDFANRHKPWDRPDWLVSAQLVLDDGRRVELRQDLAGKVDCDAVDLDLGRDCSAEIMNDDVPDAARWLGLDRSSFQATACVAQAQVLDVLNRAHGLQRHLQRAASTAGADQTAVAALARIDRFRAESVGTDRAPTRPLRRATDAVGRARDTLDRAVANHAEYERRLVELGEVRAAAARAEVAVSRHEVMAAARQAAQARALAAEASELAGRLAGAGDGERAPAGEATAVTVAAALALWRGRASASDAGSDREVTGDQPDRDDVELIRGLARELELAVPSVDPAVEARVAAARGRWVTARAARRRALFLLTGGLVSLLVGALLWAVVAGRPGPAFVVAAVLAAAGALVATVGVVRALRANPAAAGSVAAAAQTDLDAQHAAISAARVRRDVVVARCDAANLPANPAALYELARQRQERMAFQVRDAHWIRETERHAAEQLMAAARAAAVAADSPAQAAAALVHWQHNRAAGAATAEQIRRDEARLDALLAGSTLEELVGRAMAEERRADRLAADLALLDPAGTGAPVSGALPLVDPGPSAVELDEDGVRALRISARVAAQAEHAAQAALTEWAQGLVPVGEAEEELSQAEAELARLRDLDATLELTRTFLTVAQERAHRTIAPRLADGVRRWLPVATSGRYTDVTVDSEFLRVRVRGPAGRWRDADLLSYGTAEQIYLMLRVTLAEQLTRPGTSCPLLLDDVTVHADAERTGQILDLLLLASEEHQIVLFTQQDLVADWARRRLTPPRHALVELSLVAPV